MGKIELIEGAWRGYIVTYDDLYGGCHFSRRTVFGADMFVGTQIAGVGEIFRCSKDEIGLFVAVRNRSGKIIDGVWTHTHGEVETRFELDSTTGGSRCMIVKYPLLSISYEEVKHSSGPPVVFVGA